MLPEDSAHFVRSGPSHCLLRPFLVLKPPSKLVVLSSSKRTCIQRAPPPARVRGCTRLREHVPPSARIFDGTSGVTKSGSSVTLPAR